MARVSVILAVILSLFVLSHARLSTEPTTAAAAAATTITSSEISTDADREPAETLDQTVHFVPINEIGDGSLPTDDIFRHIEFSLRRPIYHHGHHFRHFRGHRRHRMRAMEIARGADAIGLPGDRFPLRSSEEKGLVKEGEAEEIKREKPMEEEEEEIEKREDDSDSESDDDEEDKVEKMEKRKRKGDCKKNKKHHHHLHRFLRHRHHRHEQDEEEKIGFMKRFWDFLNHF